MKASFQSVDDYLASQPEAVRQLLQRVRDCIRKALPEADEVISYQMPTYKLKGRAVLYFAGWKQHFSLYPVDADLVAALRDELTPYEVEKGTIRFPLFEPAPLKLIAKIAKFKTRQIS